MPETRSERDKRRDGGGLEQRFLEASPSTRHQYIDVHFLTGGVDVVIEHTLRPSAVEAVVYQIVQASAPVALYHDLSTGRRAWTQDTIVLRSNISNVVVRLLLTITAGNQETGIISPGAPGAVVLVGDLTISGTLTATDIEVGDDLHVVGSTQLDGTLNADGAVDFDSTLDVAGVHIARALIDLIGGQIAFPATQVPSADANTLDDYEEGTWTPSLNFAGVTTGITYGTQLGRYVKIGSQVWVSFRITLTSKGAAAGAANVTGLPFTTANDGIGAAGATAIWNNTTGLAGLPVLWALPNGTTLSLYASVGTLVANTNFNNTTDFVGTITYRV